MQNMAFSSAADRNRIPIIEQLKQRLPVKGTVLEIGSGTGQHAVFFADELPGVIWQPSDRQENIADLVAGFAQVGNRRILPPLRLDVLLDAWPEQKFEASYSANTAHIMSWQAVIAMFGGVSECLHESALFCLYGPFNIDGQFTSDSNRQFDLQLRARDAQMGIRDMGDIETLARENRLVLQQKIAMPANNFLLVFKKS